MAEDRFYVYRLFNETTTLYVGKGSGSRLAVQKSKYKCSGEILEKFRREKDAYNREIELIAQLKPTLNICKGGNGSRARRKFIGKYAWEKEMDRIGTRVYSARVLLRTAFLDRYLSADEISQLRQVASSV